MAPDARTFTNIIVKLELSVRHGDMIASALDAVNPAARTLLAGDAFLG
jgi:hypothetical protein